MNRFLVKKRVSKLVESLTELKVKVRAALAGELASAVGNAVRDVLVIAMIDRMVTSPPRPSTTSRHTTAWKDDEFEDRDRWDERDSWAERDEYGTRRGTHKREERDDEDEDVKPSRAVPAFAAVAVGVNVGRWWLARKGSIAAALGLGALATALGVTGGPLALAVIAATTDLLTAESALVRS